jgi:hypothetical protein
MASMRGREAAEAVPWLHKAGRYGFWFGASEDGSDAGPGSAGLGSRPWKRGGISAVIFCRGTWRPRAGSVQPVDFDGRFDGERSVDGAGVGRGLQRGALRGVEGSRHAYCHGDAGNAAGRVRHLFGDRGGCAGEFGLHGAGCDGHDAEDAASEGQREQVAWGDVFALALVVFWRVGQDYGAGAWMLRAAA